MEISEEKEEMDVQVWWEYVRVRGRGEEGVWPR
jgi:hypothetical protein